MDPTPTPVDVTNLGPLVEAAETIAFFAMLSAAAAVASVLAACLAFFRGRN
jgi:hypothetical protein